jgi:predicted DNA-binding transcriptional regulator YafY
MPQNRKLNRRNRHQIDQLNVIFQENRRNPNPDFRFPTAEQLAELLGCSRRTIFRLIAIMQDDEGLPVDVIRERGGYGYTREVTHLSHHFYTQYENTALCFAMQGLSIYKDAPFAAGVRSALRKITSTSCKELALEFDELEKRITYHCTGADAFIPPENFETLTPAVIHHQELEMTYLTGHPEDRALDGATDSEPGVRRVEPLHLACIDFGWYLYAYDPARKEIRTFALRRIRTLRTTGKTCKPRRFNIHKELAHSFGAFHGGEPEDIHLRIWGRAGQIIPEFLWHKSQVIQKVVDRPGYFDVSLRVVINPRFLGWIMEWAGEIAVRQPTSLANDFKQRLLDAYAAQKREEGILP